jgi:RNA polymerase sigma factor (sigma-70 family)
MAEQSEYDDLLNRSKRGDLEAREQLFRQLQVRLRSILKYRLWGWSRDELEDILQDTVLVVTEHLNEVESHPDRYALQVMRNKIGNRIARHRRVHISIDPTGSTSDQDDDSISNAAAVIASPDTGIAEVEDADLADRIRTAIKQLSPMCQVLFTALLENRSVADTWDFFRTVQKDLHRTTFDKRLFDCRRRLRQLLGSTA